MINVIAKTISTQQSLLQSLVIFLKSVWYDYLKTNNLFRSFVETWFFSGFIWLISSSKEQHLLEIIYKLSIIIVCTDN